MADLPEAGAKLTLDLSEWEANWSSVIADAETLQSQIDDLSGSVDVSIDLSVDNEDAVTDIESLDGEVISPELDTTESETSKEIRDGISFLATVEKIKIAIDVVGTALQFVKDMGALVVNPFLDVEDAVAKINAQTGGTGIADLGQLIRDLQFADLGDSVQQIGDTVIAAKQLNLPIKDAATAALTFTHTFQDQNPTTVMGTLADLVKTGLVPDLQTAADLMTVFFQQGGNKGGDALATVQRYADSWADMGLSITQALSLVSTLMGGGVDTADAAAKMVQTFDDKLTTAAADPASAEAKMLKMMGIDNPKTHGEAIGAETIDGFITAFSNLSTEQQDLASQIFFGKGGKINTSAIAGATTQSDMFKDYKDAASLAATEIDNSLRGAIDDFVLAVNKSISDLLSSENIDLPGKIKALKEGLQQGLNVLSQGGTVGEALEVALNIPGLSDTLDTFIGNFERIIGNMEIAFLQIVATIQDITGHGKEAEGTRATINMLSKKQLAFDLQLGNPDEISTQVNQALSRGVSLKDAGDAINTALAETLQKGDFTQGANILQGLLKGVVDEGSSPEGIAAFNTLAGKYVTNLSNGFDNAIAAGDLDLAQKFLTIPPNAKIPGLDEAVTGFKKQLSDAFTPQDRNGEAGNPFTSGMFAGTGKQGATSNNFIQGITSDFTDAATKVNETKTAIEEFDHTTSTVGTNVQTTMDTTATSVSSNADDMVASMQGTALQAQIMDTDIANAMMGNTVTASFDAVALKAAEAFPTVINWFNRTAAEAAHFDATMGLHLRSVIKQLGELNYLALLTIANVTSAQQLGGAGVGGGGTTNNITNNVNVNNNVQGNAQAATNGYAIGASLRPGG